jgi:thiol-disulfide isomerase/thioredoxin
MGESRNKNLETAANAAIVIVAIIASITMVRSAVFDGNLRQPGQGSAAPVRSVSRAPAPPPGANLSLPAVDWAKSNQTLVLALAKGCHFCAESAPFYRRLAGEVAARKDLRLVAVFPHETEDEARSYLDGLGVPIAEVEQAPLQSIGARGTPTLILADNTGKVVESWTGAQRADKEAEILARFKCETCK